jgi:hypothetical protein
MRNRMDSSSVDQAAAPLDLGEYPLGVQFIICSLRLRVGWLVGLPQAEENFRTGLQAIGWPQGEPIMIALLDHIMRVWPCKFMVRPPPCRGLTTCEIILLRAINYSLGMYPERATEVMTAYGCSGDVEQLADRIRLAVNRLKTCGLPFAARTLH